MLGRLDDFLIDRVAQPVADRFAEWTTPDAAGRSLVIGSVVFDMCGNMLRLANHSLTAATATVSGLGAAAVFLSLRLTPPPRLGTLPVAREIHWLWRLMIAPVAALAAVLLVGDALSGRLMPGRFLPAMSAFSCFCGLYFMACRQNPPQRRTSREPSRPAFATGGAS